MTLERSSYETQTNPRTQNSKIEKQFKISPLPPNLQTFKRELISGNHVILSENSLKSKVVSATINKRWRFPIDGRHCIW